MVQIKKEDSVAKEMKMNKVAVASLVAVAMTNSAFASGDSFGDLFNTFSDWLTGNLGKLLALLGFAGTFIIYMMTHKGTVLFIGIVISLIAGGMVGISETFFIAGSSAFTTH
jgi:type IV secretory pathway VirB2 component (pilin)